MTAFFKTHCLTLTLFLFFAIGAAAQNVATQHNDNNRTGWYNKETVLNTRNVKFGSFGRLFTRYADDQIYAQPLVILHLNIPGKGVKNVVFVATVNNTVYAYDADSAGVTAPYWQVNLTLAGARPVEADDMTGACGGFYKDFSGKMGIVGTPVIDTATNTMYVVARSVSNNVFYQYLHALDITTGAEKANSPKLIEAQVPGYGDGNENGIVHFNSQHHNQRSGLLLVNGNVYITYAAHCDWGPYHGWIIGYDKTTLQQTRVYNTTPEGYNGGIWMSGGGPSADDAGNIYAAVGNGSVGLNGNATNLTNRSESALRLVPNGTGFTIASYFTPNNYGHLEGVDLDFGVTQMLLIPQTNRVVTSCKDGHIYVMDRTSLGSYNADGNQVVQTIDLGTNSHLRSALGYYKGAQKEFMYSWSENAALKAFPYNRTLNNFDLAGVISSGVQGPTGNNGAVLTTSSNGSVDSTAILWASYAANGDANQSVRPGILRAFDANDVTKELWNSGVYPNDNPGNYAKFSSPTIANGKVYLPTFSNQLMVYGITGPGFDTCGAENIAKYKLATASSIEGSQYAAQNAVDANLNTRWSSEFSDPQFIQIDLGKRYDICSVILYWETALGKDFKILVSDNAQNWIPVATITGNTSLTNVIQVKGSGRYVRMYGTARGTIYGYSLWEFEVYGKESTSNCATPANFYTSNVYENSATINWSATGAKEYNVQYKSVTAGSWTSAVTSTNSINLTGLACGTDYLYVVQSVCNDGTTSPFSLSTSFSTLSCNSDCGPLPTRWTTLDIGNVGIAGTACYETDTFTLSGSGADIAATADAFRFAFQTMVGDGDLIVKIDALDKINAWNKYGLMFRDVLTAGSKNAFVGLTSANGAVFQTRSVSDGATNTTSVGAGNIVAPRWLKLSKTGAVYSGYYSADGVSWTQIGSAVNAGFGDGAVPVYAGLAITSHTNSSLTVGKASNYSVSGVLPATLLQFTASLDLNSHVVLQWITSLDISTKFFVVERSTDNIHYAAIDTINAENENNYNVNYKTQDLLPYQGINYYRLKVYDTNGQYTYSSVAAIRISLSAQPVMYPNPASGIVHIAAGSEPIKLVNIYDAAGKTVLRLQNKSQLNFIEFSCSNFAAGIYFAEIRTTENVYRQKLVVR